jgi:hypothetical protein
MCIGDNVLGIEGCFGDLGRLADMIAGKMWSNDDRT